MSSDEVEEGSVCFFCGEACDAGYYCYGCDATICNRCDASDGSLYGKHLVEDHETDPEDEDDSDDDDWSWMDDDTDEEEDDLDLDLGDEDEDE